MAKILITGTSSGIGYETAMVLARGGHTVYATMRNLERGARLRNAAEHERLPISIVEMDVDSDESVHAATNSIRAEAGPIDVLVNNAGIERSGSIEGLSLDDFKATMETNYFGPIRTIRAWLPEMRERQSGCIVNVTSVAGKIACSPLTAYAATKFALEALSEALAQEVRPFNIRCRCRTRHHRHPDGSKHRACGYRRGVPAGPPLRPYVRGIAGYADPSCHRRGEDSRDHRKRDIQAPASRWSGRRGVSRVARIAER